MKVLITGSRDTSIAMENKAEQVVLWCLNKGYEVLVGDATGIDRVVRIACVAAKVPVTVYGAYKKIREPNIGKEWERRIHLAGTFPQRDIVMARDCDMCVAVWNGISRGTKITFEAAERFKKRVIIRNFKEMVDGK